MSDFDSLTKVTRQDLEKAINNFYIRKEQDKRKYEEVLADWKKNYKLSWWQRNVSKLQNLPDDKFADETVDYFWGKLEFFVISGQLDKDVLFTIGGHGNKWKDIVFQLGCSKKDEHYVCSSASVISWLNMFGAFEGESK